MTKREKPQEQEGDVEKFHVPSKKVYEMELMDTFPGDTHSLEIWRVRVESSSVSLPIGEGFRGAVKSKIPYGTSGFTRICREQSEAEEEGKSLLFQLDHPEPPQFPRET